MRSTRLSYRPVEPGQLEEFLQLLQDDHVRRYLLDGELVGRDWAAERVRESEALFASGGLGVWLVHERGSNELVGFCGYLVLASVSPEPQLLYALLERFTGRGHATEMAAAAIAAARERGERGPLHASVDEINAASLRVLEKLGFRRISVAPGAFGPLHVLRLEPDFAPVDPEVGS
jgi:RimJ/RimL family protein N-acetyltransferase